MESIKSNHTRFLSCASVFPESPRWLWSTAQIHQAKRSFLEFSTRNGVCPQEQMFPSESLLSGRNIHGQIFKYTNSVGKFASLCNSHRLPLGGAIKYVSLLGLEPRSFCDKIFLWQIFLSDFAVTAKIKYCDIKKLTCCMMGLCLQWFIEEIFDMLGGVTSGKKTCLETC